MKIVNVIGGLGNQMFQYAFACYLKQQFPNEEILLDIHHFGHYKLHNGYELSQVFPNLSIPIASKEQVKQVTRYIPHYWWSRVIRKFLPYKRTEFVEPLNRLYLHNEDVVKCMGDYYYEGYWQAMPYYQHLHCQLQQEFTFRKSNVYNAQVADKIRASHSVGIHVRRGDYLKEPAFQGICDLDYYQRAIAALLAKGHQYSFFLFSNDMDWCRNNIEPLLHGADVCYVEGNKGKDSCWDIYLMSQCENLIIANSSFSWWGAYLNKRAKMICAPKVWMNCSYEVDIYDAQWHIV